MKHHDIGGLPAGPVDREDHDLALWERRVDAMVILLGQPSRRLMRVDEMRRQIEALGPDAYATMTYYERWCAAIAATLLERGAITVDELNQRMAEIEARSAATVSF
jgi:hypothetical protein